MGGWWQRGWNRISQCSHGCRGTHDVDWLALNLRPSSCLPPKYWNDKRILPCLVPFYLLKPALVNYYPACFNFIRGHFPSPTPTPRVQLSSSFISRLTLLFATLQRPPTQIFGNSNWAECLGWNNQPSWFVRVKSWLNLGLVMVISSGPRQSAVPEELEGKTPSSFVKVGHFLISKAQNGITNMDGNELNSNGSVLIAKIFVVHCSREDPKS